MIILCLIFDNDNLRIKTPNTVMIFSNKYPNLKKLTDDRWKILKPTGERLMDITDTAKQTCKEMKGTIDNRMYGKAEDD